MSFTWNEEDNVYLSIEYRLVKHFYGNRCAERSGVLLINHIDEGLAIMRKYCASVDAQRAYCLHPLFQNDFELLAEGIKLLADGIDIDPKIILLVMEYRNKANAWLSERVRKNRWYVENDSTTMSKFILDGKPDPGPLPEVRHMLIADKLQNYKDFCKYHMATHERSDELAMYFKTWFSVLNVGGNDI